MGLFWDKYLKLLFIKSTINCYCTLTFRYFGYNLTGCQKHNHNYWISFLFSNILSYFEITDICGHFTFTLYILSSFVCFSNFLPHLSIIKVYYHPSICLITLPVALLHFVDIQEISHIFCSSSLFLFLMYDLNYLPTAFL